MLSDLLVGLLLWTTASALAALALGRIFQRAGTQGGRTCHATDGNGLSDIA